MFILGQKFALNEEKCVISTFLRSYKIHSIDKREDVKCVNELILRPHKGIHVTIEKRT
jgi:cytochrome P450